MLDRSPDAPAAPLSLLAPAGAAAQIASGNYWETTITLVNKGNFAARARLDFRDNSGNPLTLPVTFSTTPGVAAVNVTDAGADARAGRVDFCYYHWSGGR